MPKGVWVRVPPSALYKLLLTIVEIIKENTDNLNALIKMSIQKEDYEPKVNKTLKDHSRKAQMKGFRKGMVPFPMIKKMYGKQVLLDEMNNLIKEKLEAYLKEQEFNILGEPILQEDSFKDFDLEDPGHLTVTFEIGIAPHLDIKISSRKFDHYKIKIDEKLLNKDLDKLRYKYGRLIPVDTIDENGFIQVDFEEIILEEKKDKAIKTTTTIPLNIIKDKTVLKSVLGLKKDESIEIDVFKIFDRDKAVVIKDILNIPDEKAENINPHFK